MSTFYNVGINVSTYITRISIVGGGVVSATPSKLLICRGCTQTMVVQGLFDIENNEFWTVADGGGASGDASVSGALIDEFGNQLFELQCTYGEGSNGTFSVDFGDLNFYPPIGRGYTVIVKGKYKGKGITVPLMAEVIPAPVFSGTGLAPSSISPSLAQTIFLSAYAFTNVDDSASPSYYGYVKANGAWYIKKYIDNGDGTYTMLYTAGTGDYATGWNNRLTLTYDEYDNVF